MVASTSSYLLLMMAVISYLVAFAASARSIGIILDKQSAQGVSNIMYRYRQQYYLHGPHIGVSWVVLNSSSSRHVSKTVCQMINPDIRGLITVLRCPQRRVVTAMTETFQIPHVSVDLDLCPSPAPEEYTLHLPTPPETLVTVLVDVIQSIAWKQIQIEFSGGFNPGVRGRLIRHLSLAGVKTVLRSPSDATLAPPGTLFTMEHKSIGDNDETGHGVTNVILTYDLTAQKYRNLLQENDINILFVSVRPSCLDPIPECCTFAHLTTFVDCVLASAVWVLREVLANMTVEQANQTNEDLCSVREGKTFPEGAKAMGELKTPGRWVFWNKVKEYDLYTIPAGPGFRLVHIGEWTEAGGLTLHDPVPPLTVTNNLADFGGVTLRVAVVGHLEPFARMTSSDNRPFEGVCVDMLDELARLHNFRYVFKDAPDGQYGTKSNDSWSGVIGMIARQEVDIGLSPFTMNAERLEVVDFTTPFTQDSLGILAPSPKKAFDLFQVFKPFSQSTWISVVAAVSCACAILFVIGVKSPSPPHHDQELHRLDRNIQANIFLLISSFCGQGPTFHPSSTSSRCFLTFWCVFSILITTMYTANLAAVLTVASPVKPIDTLEDLAGRDDMEIRVAKGSSVWGVAASSTRPVYQEIASRFISWDIEDDFYKSVPEKPFCTISDRQFLETMAAASCGVWRVAEERFHEFSEAFVVGKGSPYKVALDHSLQVMVESGFIDYLKKKWSRIPGDCAPDTSSQAGFGLNMDRLVGVFTVYGVAVLAAFITLILELCITCCIGVYLVDLVKWR